MSLTNVSYDIELPFQLSLADEDEVVHCLEKVRVIPGKRLVCKGKWREQDVYIKIFVASKTARRDCQREVAGSTALIQHKISAAQIIYQGQLPDHHSDLPVGHAYPPTGHAYLAVRHAYVVIYSSIQPALDLADAWPAATLDEKQDLLFKLTRVIAQHHQEGISQQDMHLRNFVLSEKVIYTLDAADIRIGKGELKKNDSLHNLAQLFALISPLHDDLVRKAFKSYAQIRGWQSNVSQLDAFMIKVSKLRQRKRGKYIRKIFRESSAFISRKSMWEFAVYDRLFDGEDLRQLLQDPDASIEEGEIIKRGNTCTIAAVKSDAGTLIVKRYNIKNSWHAVRRSLAQTRAAISWRNAHRLQFCRIRSAHPVALLEKSFGPVHFQSYFIMQEVTGPTFSAFFQDPSVSVSDKENAAVGMSDLFKRLSSHRISHGDMKATNFIINNNQPVLLDLDAMREHTSLSTFKKAHARDLRRFFHNWRDTPDICELFRETFARAGIQVQSTVTRR